MTMDLMEYAQYRGERWIDFYNFMRSVFPQDTDLSAWDWDRLFVVWSTLVEARLNKLNLVNTMDAVVRQWSETRWSRKE